MYRIWEARVHWRDIFTRQFWHRYPLHCDFYVERARHFLRTGRLKSELDLEREFARNKLVRLFEFDSRRKLIRGIDLVVSFHCAAWDRCPLDAARRCDLSVRASFSLPCTQLSIDEQKISLD